MDGELKAGRGGILNRMWGTLKEKEIDCVLHKKKYLILLNKNNSGLERYNMMQKSLFSLLLK